MKKIFLSILFLIAWASHSQVYPVQVNAQLIPPYSMKLTDYEQMTDEKLFVNLLLTDINEVNRQVRLKMYIDGPGIHIQNVDMVQGVQPIFLDGGVSLQLTNLDLRPYFRFDNLQGISIQQYNSFLPDGAYHFCFEVYDYVSNQLLSQKGCAHAFLLLNDPPFLNIPFDNDIVTAQNPQNIVFTWTPRHVNAINVTYDYTLKELIDPENTDIVVAFAGGIPMLQETLHATSLVYGPAETPLMEGKTYAWQVRAYVTDGFTETALFRNNGYSEIYKFIYTANCPAPTNIMSDAIDATTEHIVWTGAPEHLQYNIQYRKIGANDWFEQDAYNEEVTLHNLEAEQVYEFRVGGQCMAGSGFAYSSIYQFTMPDESSQASYNCGLPPPNINTTNQNPLPQLNVNQTFTAGDFSVKVTEVSGSNGVFTGKGMIVFNLIKGLAGITDTSPINIAVKFEDIHINTDFQLTDGFVKTTYDPTWGDIVDSNAITDNLFGETGNINSYDASNIDIDDIQVDTTATVGNVTLIDNTGTSHSITTGLPVVIHGDNNETWVIDEDGHVTQVETAQGGQATAQNTNGVTNSGNVTQITSTDVSVVFNPGGYYSSDPIRLNTSQDFKDQYDKIPQTAGGDYYPLYKLIARQPDSIDYVTAQVSLSNGKTKDDIVFKTRQGLRMDTVIWNGNTATLKFKNRFRFAKEKILACVKPADTTQNYDIAGTMNLWHTRKGDTLINVKLVPVGNAQISANTIAGITEIYQKAGIRLNITQDSPFDITQSEWDIENPNGVLDIGDSGLLANYTPEERAIYNKYKQERTVVKKMYYMFVLDSSIPVSDTGVTGFMPLKRQFGFAFNPAPGAQARTIAHELGHGIFGLKHPFDEYNFAQGSTDLLMDYGTGTKFSHMDWQKMHAPGVHIYWFQGDEEGEFSPYQLIKGYNVVTGRFINAIPNYDANYNHNSVSFISKTGKIYTLPNTVRDVTFDRKGKLLGFTLTENNRTERYFTIVYADNIDKFVCYGKKIGTNLNWMSRTYHDRVSKLYKSAGSHIVYLGIKTDNPCGIDIYSRTISTSNVDSTGWNSGGHDQFIDKTTDYSNNATFITHVESPPACDLCNEGNNFYNAYANTTSDGNILRVVEEIAHLICEKDQNGAFRTQFIANGYNNLLQWQKDFFKEYSVDLTYNNINAFYNGYKKYLEYYDELKNVIDTSDVTNREAILRVAYELDATQLDNLTADQKLSMLKIMANGRMGGYWTGGNYNVEGLALRIFESVDDSQAYTFLAGLISSIYAVDQKYLFEELSYRMDDKPMGENNFTKFYEELTRLSRLINGITTSDTATIQQYIENHSDIPRLYWDVENSSFLWIFNTVIDKSGLVVNYNPNDHSKVNLKQCNSYGSTFIWSSNSGHSEEQCLGYKTFPEKNIFDIVSLTIINDISFTKYDDKIEVGKETLVPAVFLNYLIENKNTQSIINTVQNTGTVLSLISSGGTIVGGIRAGEIVSARVAVAATDIFVTMADPYFSGDGFRNSVINSLTGPLGADKASRIADMLQSAWTGVSFGVGFADLALPAKSKSVKSLASYEVLKENTTATELRNLLGNKADEIEESFNKLKNKINAEGNAQFLENELVDLRRFVNNLSYKPGLIDFFTNNNLTNLKNWIQNLNEAENISFFLKLDDYAQTQQGIDRLTKLDYDLSQLTGSELSSFQLTLRLSGTKLDAWYKIRSAIGNTTNNGFTKFATDNLVISRVESIMQDGSIFRNKMAQINENWEDVLVDILRTNSNLRCNVCGNAGIAYRSEMHHFLDEVEYFIANFNITTNSKGKRYFNMLQGKKLDGTAYNNINLPVFDELHQALTYLKNKQYSITQIEGFGLQLGNTGKYGDITKINCCPKHIELKSLKQGQGLDDGLEVLSGLNVSPLKNRTQFVDQFINGYLKKINTLDELNYVFDIRKLSANGETFIKNQFKELFIANAENMFNNLGRQKIEQLFLINGINEIRDANHFKALLNNNTAFKTNALKFIKVE